MKKKTIKIKTKIELIEVNGLYHRTVGYVTVSSITDERFTEALNNAALSCFGEGKVIYNSSEPYKLSLAGPGHFNTVEGRYVTYGRLIN